MTRAADAHRELDENQLSKEELEMALAGYQRYLDRRSEPQPSRKIKRWPPGTDRQCADCRQDEGRERGHREYYMVHNVLWGEYAADAGLLCIGCLEKRIGRTLRAADFTDAPINAPSSWDTPLLAARKADTAA